MDAQRELTYLYVYLMEDLAPENLLLNSDNILNILMKRIYFPLSAGFSELLVNFK